MSVQVQKKDTEKGGLSGGGSDTGRGLQGLFEPSPARSSVPKDHLFGSQHNQFLTDL